MKSFHNSKKAQLTVFIIIGVIMVFSVGIYTYLRTTGVSPAEIFQPKAPPVVAFIDACLERTATEAIKGMGDQGGYLVIPPAIAFNPTRHISLVPGVANEFSPKIPYWYYEGKTQIPGLKYMELEIENYINDNLEFCLNNFDDLRDEYIINELSDFQANVVLTEGETVVGLDYSIEITPRGAEETTKRDQFIIKLDVQLKKMWELAKEILEAENKQTFYENMTIDLMASHPPEDVPFTGLSVDCEKRHWLLSEVKKKVIRALEPAVLAIRFQNTDHPPFVGKDDEYRAVHAAVEEWRNSPVPRPLRLPKNIPEDSFDYFQYFFRFTDKDYRDFKVISQFKGGWGMKFLATPNQYGVMRSGVQDLKSEILSFVCVNRFHFVYDVVYPVVISINDPEALHKTGYSFRFAFPVQIFHNKPDRSLLPTKIIEPIEYPLEYCDTISPDEHTIIARDAVTNAELSRVNLTFRCISQECLLGTTRTNNRHLQWSGNFPEGCFGPIIRANRSGYLLTEAQHDGTEPFFIDMFPTQPVKFEVKRHPENAPGSARRLDPDMYAIIQLENTKFPPLTVLDVFGGQDIFNRTDTFELLRSDATYYLNIILMKKSGDEDLLIGGWIGNWTVDLVDMLDAKKIVFHVPQKYPPPKSEEDVIRTYEIMSNHSIYPDIQHEILRADEFTGEPAEAQT